MMSLFWFALFVAVALFVAYRRFSLLNSTIAVTALLVAYTAFGAAGPLWKGLLWLALAALWLLNVKPLRQTFITKPFLLIYRRLLPPMSSTE
jgi:hypothetical protein